MLENLNDKIRNNKKTGKEVIGLNTDLYTVFFVFVFLTMSETRTGQAPDLEALTTLQ